jgi:hypothetical protein
MAYKLGDALARPDIPKPGNTLWATTRQKGPSGTKGVDGTFDDTINVAYIDLQILTASTKIPKAYLVVQPT